MGVGDSALYGQLSLAAHAGGDTHAPQVLSFLLSPLAPSKRGLGEFYSAGDITTSNILPDDTNWRRVDWMVSAVMALTALR